MRVLKKLGFAKYFRMIREAMIFYFDLLGGLFFYSKEVPVDKTKVNKILLIRTDRIGDLILSTPAIRAVRQTFPQAELHLLVSGYTRDLVAENKDIDKLLIFEKDRPGNDYDLAVALNPGIHENYLTCRSGAKYRAGYKKLGGSFFLTHKLKNEKEIIDKHEVLTCLGLVGLLGCKTENRNLEVSVTKEGEEFAEKYLDSGKDSFVAVIHPGARQEYIRWKKEGFAEVADRLIAEKGAKVLLLGSADETGLIDEIKVLMKGKPFVLTNLKLTKIVSVIKRVRLFVGNSTGPMHIAAALGVPTVAIFGSQNPQDSYKKWSPWSEKSIVVKADINCPDCHPSDCKTFECIKKITPDDVMLAVNKLLGEN